MSVLSLCGEGSQTGEVHNPKQTASHPQNVNTAAKKTQRVMFFKNQEKTMRDPVRPMPFLSDSNFSRREAEAVAAAWENAFIEDDQTTHFRVAVRYPDGMLMDRAWNFEAGGGEKINRYLEQKGIPAKQEENDTERKTQR
ncbi:DUF905 family protein [Klebsiella sp. PL-2018]|uniref:DUF905 family protein n=1 Tax=Klebsiella sp. PL-2018 TaxID=2851540 RepID=UPI003A5D1326